MREVIAAGPDVVVPRGKPDCDAGGNGSRHLQLVTDCEREDQGRAAEDQREGPAARDRIKGQEQQREDQRRSEVFLQEEKPDSQRHSGNHRNGVLQARHIKAPQPARAD